MVHVGINFGTALFVSILKHIWIYVICICFTKSHENEMFPVIDEVKLSVHAHVQRLELFVFIVNFLVWSCI